MKIRARSARLSLVLWLLWLAAGLGAGCKSRSAAVVEFAPSQPDAGEIQRTVQADREELAKAGPPSAAELRLIELWTKINTLSLSRPRDDQDALPLDQALASLRSLTNRVLQDQGVSILRLACLRLVDTFEADLKALLGAAVSADLSTALLSGAPPPAFIRPQYDKFVQTAGDFLLHAANSGLLKQGKDGRIELTPGSELFLRIAFKARFANIVPEVTNPFTWLLRDFERKWYYLWVIEHSRTSPLQRKLDSILALKSLDPGYPDDTARGIVLFKAQKFDQAKLAFESALKKTPQDPRVQSFLAAAKQHR